MDSPVYVLNKPTEHKNYMNEIYLKSEEIITTARQFVSSSEGAGTIRIVGWALLLIGVFMCLKEIATMSHKKRV